MIICKYKFDSSIYNNLIPEFNSGYNGYTVSDVIDGNIVTRTIECDTLPTLIKFGFTSDSSISLNEAKSLIEVLLIDFSNSVNLRHVFCNCQNLKSIDTTNWDTSKATSMYGMFDACYNLTSLDASNWDTKNVTGMAYMFNNCNKLTTIDVSNWDTSSVTSMQGMFQDCQSLTTVDASNFDTSKVTRMDNMFNGCTKLTSLDVSNWDTSSVTNIQYMFCNCQTLTSLDVSNWNTSKVTNMKAFMGLLNNAKTLNLNNLHATDEKTIIEGDDRFLINTVAEKIYLNDLDTLNTVMRFLPDRAGKESGKLVTTLRNKISEEILTTLTSKNWKIVNLVAQYRYDANTYEDLIPKFNTEFTSDKYEVYDSVSEIVIDNIQWEEGAIDSDGGDSFDRVDRIRCKGYYSILPNTIYKTSDGSINFHWYDSNKTYIASGHKYANSCVSPANAKYVRFHNSTTAAIDSISAKLITRIIESKNGDLPTLIRFGQVYVSGEVQEDYTRCLLKVLDMNTSELTDCYSMFRYCTNLTQLDVSNFDTRNVTTMQGMFYNCKNLTQLDVSNFDTRNVTIMQNMFNACNNLTQLDVSNFDTRNVTNMSYMFNYCTNLTQLDVSNFDTNKVNNMDYMFNNCKNLTQLDVSNFDTRNVTNMYSMFNNCTNLTSLDISNFNVANVTDFTNFLADTKIKLIKCLNPSTINTLIQYLPDKTSSSNGVIIIDNRDNLNTNELTNKNWSIISTSDEYIVVKYKYDKSIYFDLIPEFNDDYDSYFIYNEYNDEDDNVVTRKIVSNVLPTLMRFGRIYVSGESTTDNRTDSLLEVLDMSTRGLTNCHSMFRYNTNLTSITCNWNTSNVTTMQDMFHNCSNLTQLDVSNFNTSNVNNMSYMFYNCTNLTSLDASNWNTSQVIDMSYMFTNCNNLTSLDLSNFNTSSVTTMGYMFNACVKLTQLDVSKFNTSNVTNMYSMFNNCKNLTQLDVSKFNTSQVTNMQAMFYGCTNLTSLNVSNFDTSDVTTMQSMFNGCNNLTQLDVSNFDTSNVWNMSYMFYNCNNLTQLDLSNFDTSKVTNMDYMFYNTSKLVNIGMLYCSPSTINTISSNLSNPTTVWINGNIIKSELTSYDNITYEIYYYDKELLLNSPLLEGDKIVKKDGKLYHYHKMGMIIFDGSEDDWMIEETAYGIGAYRVYTQNYDYPGGKGTFNLKTKSILYSNLLPHISEEQYTKTPISGISSNYAIGIKINSVSNKDGFKQWLQQNPTTVVYELANPYYELISEDKDLSLTLPSTDNILTNNSLIPTNMNVKNSSMSTVGISNSSTYTVVFDKDTDNNIVVNLNGTSIETSDNRVEITTSNELSENELTFIGEGEISNVRILDGSVSGDNIPRESFEGLKSSFEDSKIPSENLLVNTPLRNYAGILGTGGGIQSLVKSNTTYTLAILDSSNKLRATQISSSDSNNIWLARANTGNMSIMKFTTPNDISAEVNLYLYTIQAGTSEFEDTDIELIKTILLEGDWTHLTVEDFNHLGQYKVEYKVTGKNKLADKYKVEGYLSGGFGDNATKVNLYKGSDAVSYIIPCKPNIEYILSNGNGDRTAMGFTSDYPTHDTIINSTLNNRITTDNNAKWLMVYVNSSWVDTDLNCQLEEGTAATEYEPYKEYTKTFYLNSPLLEGDTIEDVNGVATHVHRMGKVVLDGSEDEEWFAYQQPSETISYGAIKLYDMKQSMQSVVICDNYVSTNDGGQYDYLYTKEQCYPYLYYTDTNFNRIYFHILNSKLPSYTIEGFRQWFTNNPTTVVYELAQPWNEPIGAYGKIVFDGSEDWMTGKYYEGELTRLFYVNLSNKRPFGVLKINGFTELSDYYLDKVGFYSGQDFNIRVNESILADKNDCVGSFKQWLSRNPITAIYELAEPSPVEPLLLDSYVNGHLDFDSTVPVEKVDFKYMFSTTKYSIPSTKYIVQFESDNVGKLDMLHYAGTYLRDLEVIKGLNTFSITSDPSNGSNAYFTMRGIGFNASNIQVVATERDNIGYFKGIQSSFEDKVIKGKNLFNKDKIVLNYAIDLNGTITNPSFEYHSTEYIECKPNTSYTCNFGTGIHYFDENKTWISYQNHSTLSPSNAKYLIKCILQTADLNRIQIEEGEYVTTYESYGDKYEVEVSMVGKNKWKYGDILNKDVYQVYLDEPLKKGNYVISSTCGQKYEFNPYITFLNDEETIVGANLVKDGRLVNISKDINRIVIYSNGYDYKASSGKPMDFTDIQLEEGTTKTEYKPYKETRETIYLNSPLLKGDRIEMYNGKLCHYHKMGKVVLDGSEDEGWLWSNDGFAHSTKLIKDVIKKDLSSNKHALCDTLQLCQITKSTSYKGIYLIGGSYEVPQIRLRITDNDTLDSIKQWLQANPTTAVYELAEPYYEEITPEHNEFTIVSIGESSFTIDSGNVSADGEVTYNVNVKLLNDLEENMNSNTSSTNVDLTTILDDIINE